MKKIIIIPVHNEAQCLQKVINSIRENSPDIDIVVIDDGSMDQTVTIAQTTGAIVISLPYNLGYGAALQIGYKYAIAHEYDIIVQMDGDGQHDPDSIADLLVPLEANEADIVIGSRFLGKGTYRAHRIRRIGMIIFAKIASIVLRQKITDPTSGFQAMTRKVAALYATDIFPHDFPDVDIIIMTSRAGVRIKEVPVIMHPDITMDSMHRGLTDVYYVFKMFLSIAVTLLRKKVPFNKEDSL